MLIFAFGHKKSVGKSYAARAVYNFLSPELVVKIDGFANKLKDICYQLYWWAGLQPGDYYESEENYHKKNIILPFINISPREIWLKFGTNAVRNHVYQHTWVDYLINYHKQTKCDVLLITDLRFPDEFD